MTGCKAFPEGDLFSWEGDSWFLNSSRNTVCSQIPDGKSSQYKNLYFQAREESADLEKEVCQSTSTSLHLVPQPLKVAFLVTSSLFFV